MICGAKGIMFNNKNIADLSMNNAKLKITLFVFNLVFLLPPIHSQAQEKDGLLYENSFSKPEKVDDWVMEGPGKLEFKDGWMHIYAPDEKWHHVFWCPKDFPGSFIAEWEAQNLETDAGLCIIFFAATGINGEDIFDSSLPERDGTFKYYIKDKLNSYHISYYANTPNRPDRGDSHIRKNTNFHLVQTGEEGISTNSEKIHKMKLIKDNDHIVMYVDDRKIIDWTDDGEEYGPVHQEGKIGFRQMQWTHFRYRNFKVWDLKTE